MTYKVVIADNIPHIAQHKKTLRTQGAYHTGSVHDPGAGSYIAHIA